MDIYTTRFYLLILLCNLSFYQRLLAVSSSLPLTVCLCNQVTTSSSTISQLEAGLIIVRAMKSICKLSLPLRVYGPMKSTHTHFQKLLMMVLGRMCPYLSLRLLMDWQVLHDLVIDQMVVRIPFRYIAGFIVSSRYVCPVVMTFNCMHLEWLRDNRPTIFADISSVLNESDLQSFINHCILLKEVFQGSHQLVELLQFLLLLEGIFCLFAAIWKHFIHWNAV
jgi:hypothetical protein